MTKRVAQIENGVVVNVIMTDDDYEVNGGTEVESADANVGWIVSGGALVAPPRPAPSTDDLRVYAASRRFDREVGGVAVAVSGGSKTFATDRESQSKIMAVFIQASFDPNYSVTWKAEDGFVNLSNAEILAVAQAVREHVQAAFAAEALADAGIEGGTIATFEEVEAVIF